MKAQNVERFVAQTGSHHLGDVAVVAEAHMHVLEAALRLVDAVFGLVFRHVAVGILREILGKTISLDHAQPTGEISSTTPHCGSP